MRRVTRLTSPANARLKAVVRLRRQRERRRTGRFVAEGRREIERAVAAGLNVHAFYYCDELLEGTGHESPPASLIASLPGKARVFEVTRPLFQKMALLPEPAGLLAVVDQPIWSLAGLPAVNAASLYLLAVGIEKPGNLGAMARTAAAAGCEAMVLGESVVDPFNPHAIRNSTGAVFTLPVVSLTRPEMLDFAKAKAIRIAAATLEDAESYTAADLTGPLAIAVGPEDAGLDAAWRAAAEATAGPRLTIPMRSGTVDSLNAANAAAVLLFEARRQRETREPASQQTTGEVSE